MCISNAPVWFQVLSVILGPLAIIILDIFLIKMYRKAGKKIAPLIIISVILAIFWISFMLAGSKTFC